MKRERLKRCAEFVEAMKDIRDIFAGDIFKGKVAFDEPMKKHTTLRIGGPADIYAVPDDVISMRSLLLTLKDSGIPVIPIGGGSNLLVTDEGIEGAVLSVVSFNRIEMIKDDDDGVRLFVEAGVPLQRLINLSKDRGYKGIEGLAGIPGTIGGAIKGNAGSFGFELSDVIESVALIDIGGRIFQAKGDDLNFGYRSSGIPDGAVILSANIRLEKDSPEDVDRRINAFLQDKRKKQPLSEHSAGCVFKNPDEGPAGRLIDEACCKGMRRGDIEVSSLHANFFINRGDGKASDFLGLMEDVKERVFRLFGIELEPEIRIVGRYVN
ncbi:MAG: UDP-N-acetylmuramate dehydrogenase [Thermodesulfovibrionales bacterium]